MTLRLILIIMIIALIVRAFIIAGQESRKEKSTPVSGNKENRGRKGVPGELGEYIDYEEVGKNS